jgi:hypothetical protein
MKKSATEMAEIITKFTYQGISAFLKEKQALAFHIEKQNY